MQRMFKALTIIVILTLVGCSQSPVEGNDQEPIDIDEVKSYFTGTIKDINGNQAIVYAKLGGGKGDVVVNLSVNNDETFQINDKVKVGFDGIVMESHPAQINTISVELID